MGWPGKVFPIAENSWTLKVPEGLRLWTVEVTFHSYCSRVCHVMGTRYTLVCWVNEGP